MKLVVKSAFHSILAHLALGGALGLALGSVGADGAERPANGAAVYRQACLKCHGKAGEGVKDKYQDALQGDWSLDRLTHYIEKKMPEDDPGKCVGPNAEAVARYIYGAFYSREARARRHPVRVELTHLTNRQYVQSVADLLGQFNEPGTAPVRRMGGLQAVYYASRNTQRSEVTVERVDAQVNFDFGTNAPAGGAVPTNGFAIHWRGAVRADETGEYEFSLQTPNGVRLWVNDETTPLIDGSVASGTDNEPRATLRLIGGRAYPLRLELVKVPYNFKAPKNPNSAIVLQWKPPHGARQVIPARNLSPETAKPTFVVAAPFPADDSSAGYERGAGVSKAWDEATTRAAGEVAAYVVKHLDRLARTRSADADRAAKVTTFCGEFVAAAFRRPLTPEQNKGFITAPLAGAPKLEDGVRRVVLLALKSPRFLYPGWDAGKPDDFTVAERLAVELWDSLPDAELRQAAARGALHEPAAVAAQARRMLADARTRTKLQYFLQQWLQMNRVEDLSKDPLLYPGFTPELIADLRVSLNLFLEDVVWNGASDYRRLLLDRELFVNGRMARFYGYEFPPAAATNDFVKVAADPARCSGVVTHPYLLTEFSYAKSSSPIHRGVFLTRNIVGRSLKPPPMAQVFKDADFDPNLTMREKVAALTRPAACQACHSVINPLGFSLEQYDAVGRFHAREGGRVIDAGVDYPQEDGSVVRFQGPRAVAEFAAGSADAQTVFIEQLFHQLVQQSVAAYGPDVLDRLRQNFLASGCHVQNLVVEITTLAARQGYPSTTAVKKQL